MKKINRKILQRVMAALLSAMLVMGMAQTASASETRDNINTGDAQPHDEEEYIIASGNDWKLNEFGKLTIKSDAGMEDLKNDESFIQYTERVKSVELQDGVTSIADGMFIGYVRMTDITIPSGLTSIGEEAFEYCRSLKEVAIPSGVTSIGVGAFMDCTGLTEITLPPAMTSIEDAVFSGCENLRAVSVPSGVTSIGASAFAFCKNLEEITIPSGVTSMGAYMFDGCESLKEITIPSGVTSIPECMFYYCKGLEKITLPSGVTSIGESAFNNCYRLTEITLPDGLTEIGDYAFRDCSSLNSVTMLGETPPELGEYVFVNCKFSEEEKSIHVPVGKSEDYKAAWADWESYIVGDVEHIHSWDNGEITQKPTCTETGVRVYTCTVCGETKTETVGASGHSYEGKSDEASHWQECSVCGDKTEEASHSYGEWTVVKPATDNDDGLKERYCTVCSRMESGIIPKTGSKEAGRIDISVRSDGKAPYIQPALSAEEAENTLLTDGEKEQLANGTDIDIILDVKDISESVSSEDKSSTEAALNGFTVCMYLDISLYKLIGGNRTDITETESKIAITIAVPDKPENTGGKAERTFAVIRLHNAQTELLPDLDCSDDTITIETDCFSTYAIVYKDAANAGNGGSGEGGSEWSEENGSGVNPPDNTDSKPDSSNGNLPSTGDAAPLEMYATLAMIAGASYLLLYFADRERGMTEETKKRLVFRLAGWAKRGGRIRKFLALAAIFMLLAYYHSIGKKICAESEEACGE